ncbi:MAG: LytTR family transcriptional regulator [Bacteroidales bacterium]|nr:LytTR family transcriptional regulator [Bacteroidales bacterium]
MKYPKRLITQTPECLTEPVSQSINVIISTLFALVFLTAYVPFSATAWFQVGKGSYFFTTLAFVGTGTLFLALSRTLMTWLVKKLRHFPFWFYILWLFLEIVLISVYYSLLSYFQIQPTGGENYGFAYILAKSFLITLIALGVPYTVTDLVILLKDTQQRLMLTKSDTVESDNEVMPEHTEIINLMDNNGNLKLSVKLDNLFYIKAEDNYINVFYQRNGTIASYMLRCKMQTIADNCVDSSSLMRCHRSYIVNINKVSVLHNEADGFVIDFEREGLESIPVSKTYSSKVLEAFNKK